MENLSQEELEEEIMENYRESIYKQECAIEDIMRQVAHLESAANNTKMEMMKYGKEHRLWWDSK